MEGNNKNIVICGYPKSGTTWLTRLVGEMLDCPVTGSWGFSNDFLTAEGEERISEYRCFKSHHVYEELLNSNNDIHRVIYIYRDPRDVVISGAHHFIFIPDIFKKILGALVKSDYWRFWIQSKLNLLVPLRKRKNLMTDLVLGNRRIKLKWLDLSWSDHINEFRNKDVLIIKYEDLVKSRYEIIKDIMVYLGKDTAHERIEELCNYSSFETMKKGFEEREDYFNQRLMRSGKSDQWKSDLPKKLAEKITLANESLLKELGYEV